MAQHSVYVARLALAQTKCPKTALMGLLHDASEAYLSDIARPVKQTKPFEPYRALETRLQYHIYRGCFVRLDPEAAQVVTEIDQKIVTNEAMWLMPRIPAGWEIAPGFTHAELKAGGCITFKEPMLTPWYPELAEQRFMDTYNELVKAIGEDAEETW